MDTRKQGNKEKLSAINSFSLFNLIFGLEKKLFRNKVLNKTSSTLYLYKRRPLYRTKILFMNEAV